jgi:hypothetical protein
MILHSYFRIYCPDLINNCHEQTIGTIRTAATNRRPDERRVTSQLRTRADQSGSPRPPMRSAGGRGEGRAYYDISA